MITKRKQIGTIVERQMSLCPIAPTATRTRMLKTSFDRLCALRMQADDGYCTEICKGKIPPPGVEFIDLETFKNEVEIMEKVCWLCKEKKTVRRNLGKESCGTCETIWRNTNNAPSLVVQALIESQGQEWVDKNFTVDTAPDEKLVADLQAVRADLENIEALREGELGELYRLREAVRELRWEVALTLMKEADDDFSISAEVSLLKQNNNRLEEQLAEIRTDQYDQRLELAAELGFAAEETFDIVNEVSVLKQENARLRELLVTAAEEIEGNNLTAELCEISSKDSALLDLAIDILDGKVIGIDSSRLRALR